MTAIRAFSRSSAIVVAASAATLSTLWILGERFPTEASWMLPYDPSYGIHAPCGPVVRTGDAELLTGPGRILLGAIGIAWAALLVAFTADVLARPSIWRSLLALTAYLTVLVPLELRDLRQLFVVTADCERFHFTEVVSVALPGPLHAVVLLASVLIIVAIARSVAHAFARRT